MMWEFTLGCGYTIQRFLLGVPTTPTRVCRECLKDSPTQDIPDYRFRPEAGSGDLAKQ